MRVNFKKISFWIFSLILTALALLIISLILLATQNDPFLFLEIIFVEPWKNINYFSGFLNIFAVLLLAGLSIAVTFKYKIYNFGVPGQMLISAMVTYITAVAISNAGGTHRSIVLFLLLLACIVGASIGFIVAFLKSFFKVNEIISTILFNFIIWEGYKGLLASSVYKNQRLPDILSLRFSLSSSFFSSSYLFSAGIIIAVLTLIIVVIFFSNHIFLFKLKAIAKNPIAAKQANIRPNAQILKILSISGGLAGLSGYLYFLSTNNFLAKLDTIPQEGFYAIVVAGLAFYEPAILFLSTVFFTLFIRPISFNSFIYLKNPTLIVVILGVTIYLMGFFPFIWYLWDQSPFIQEKWFKIKRKLFNIATPIEEKIPGLESSDNQKEIKSLNINLNLEENKQNNSLNKKSFKKKRKRKG